MSLFCSAPEAQPVLFGALGRNGLRIGISGQQLAIHPSRRVKLAKKVHHTGRRKSDFHRHFSLSRDIHIQVLIRDAEIVQRTRLVLDFHLELLSGRPSEKGWREVIVIGLARR